MNRKALVPMLALSCGVLLGTGVVAYAATTTSEKNPQAKPGVAYSDPEMYQEVKFDKPNYPVNEDGYTYGSDIPGMNIAFEDEADLQLVTGDNGVVGYCYKKDLYDLDNLPHNPEEAMEYMEKNRGKKRVLNVYESDGKTVIGTLTG